MIFNIPDDFLGRESRGIKLCCNIKLKLALRCSKHQIMAAQHGTQHRGAASGRSAYKNTFPHLLHFRIIAQPPNSI